MLMWLTGLALLPVLAHLFARRKPPRRDFPDVRFLNELARQAKRFERPRDMLLLAMRTLAVLFLAAAFALPVYYPAGRMFSSGGAHDVVIIVDRSLSMQYAPAGVRHFDQALARARGIIDGLPPGSRADLVWLDSSPAPFTGKLTDNLASLRNELERGTASYSDAKPAAALRSAARMLTDENRTREIHVISDFQATNWRDVNVRAAVPREINVVMLAVDRHQPGNVAVASVSVSPSVAIAGENVMVSARVVNYSAENRSVGILVKTGGFHRQDELYVPPWGEAEALWCVTVETPGEQPVEVSISRDRLAADDARFAVIQVRRALSAALAGKGGSLRFVSHALAAMHVDAVSLDVHATPTMQTPAEEAADANAPPQPFDVLMAAGVPFRDVSAHVDYQGAVLFMDETPAAYAADASRHSLELPEGHELRVGGIIGGRKWRGGKKAEAFHLDGVKDEIFDVFSGGSAGDFSSPAIYAYRQIEAPPGAKVLLFYQDDNRTPALMRLDLPGGRVLYIWNISLSPDSSDFAGSNVFLPLLGEIISRCRRPMEKRVMPPGVAPSFILPPEADTSAVLLKPPYSPAYAPRLTMKGGGVEALLEPMDVPGIYTLEAAGRPMAVFAVNPPLSESDLRPLSFDGGGSVVLVPADVSMSALREGVRLWPPLIAAALALLAAESLAAAFLRPRQEDNL